MKKLLIVVAVCVAGSASAQVAQIETFGSPEQANFSVLVPGGPKISVDPDALNMQAVEHSIGNVVVDPVEPLTYVPSWMRAGKSPFSRFKTQLPYFGSTGCKERGFFERGGIGKGAKQRRRLYFPMIVDAACAAGIPIHLFDALISQESRYRVTARSHAGAMGLAQLMPDTARYLGVTDPWDAAQNLRGGARYLREQYDRFGQWDLALAAYNAGPGNVSKYNGIPPFRETRGYVRTILATTEEVGTASRNVPASNPFRRVRLTSYDSGL